MVNHLNDSNYRFRSQMLCNYARAISNLDTSEPISEGMMLQLARDIFLEYNGVVFYKKVADKIHAMQIRGYLTLTDLLVIRVFLYTLDAEQ